MDRNAILGSLVSSFSAYSANDSRPTVRRVLKYSGRPFNIRKRGDVLREVVFFRLLSAVTTYNINDEKPQEIRQNIEALVYLEQTDSHSSRNAIYDRALEITDLLADWSIDTSANAISSDVWTLTLTDMRPTEEQNGYLSTTVNFQSIIKLQ